MILFFYFFRAAARLHYFVYRCDASRARSVRRRGRGQSGDGGIPLHRGAPAVVIAGWQLCRPSSPSAAAADTAARPLARTHARGHCIFAAVMQYRIFTCRRRTTNRPRATALVFCVPTRIYCCGRGRTCR